MTRDEYLGMSAADIARRVHSGDVSAREVLDAALGRIGAVDPRVDAFLCLTEEEARRAAEDVDRAVAEGRFPGPLAGVPVAVKDNLCTDFAPTTCASRILEGYVPPYNAAVVERLRSAGALIVGKTNMDEFAMGSSCENSAFKPTRNPWDPERIPGGSSGGSAAAVAAGMVPVSLGSDTGGSIRQPAAMCGVVGVKPTYGRVSRWGLVAFGSSLDQVGPFARTVEDAALLLRVVSGRDGRDSTSAPEPVPDYVAGLEGGVEGLKVGLPVEFFSEGVQPEVEEAVRGAAGRLEALGCELREVRLPHTGFAVAVYYIAATAEASSNLARFDGVHYGFRCKEAEDIVEMYCRTRREGFGPEVKRRIMLGTFALSSGYHDAFYKNALKVRSLIRRDFEDVFGEVDVLLAPTTPTTAFRLGEKVDDPLAMYLSDIFTIGANLAGVPAVNVPCGVDALGLPVGMQLIGPDFSEGLLLRVAAAFEKASGTAFPTATALQGI